MRYRRTRTDGGSVEKSWNSGNPGDAGGASAPRITVYQNPAKAPQAQSSATGGFLSSGWLGSSDRPKSAGIATSGGIMSAFSSNRGAAVRPTI